MRRALSWTIAVLLATLAVVVPVGSAEAAWSTSKSGFGSAQAITLSAPTGLTVICPSLSLAAPKVSWTALPYSAKYDIYRKTGNAAGLGTVIAAAQTFGTFTDSTAPNGGLNVYYSVTYSIQAVQVGAAASGWKSPSASAAPVSVTLGACIL